MSTISKLEARVKILENETAEYNRIRHERRAVTENENDSSNIQQSENLIELKCPKLECNICR